MNKPNLDFQSAKLLDQAEMPFKVISPVYSKRSKYFNNKVKRASSPNYLLIILLFSGIVIAFGESDLFTSIYQYLIN